MDLNAETQLTNLAAEYNRCGRNALLISFSILGIFYFLKVRPMVAHGLSHLPPGSFQNPAILGAGSAGITAILVVAIIIGFPIFFLILGNEIKKKKNYKFCRRGAEIISLFRPYGPYLSVKTLLLLDQPEIKRAFNFNG